MNVKLNVSNYSRNEFLRGMSLSGVRKNHNQKYEENKKKIYENFKNKHKQDFDKSYKFCEIFRTTWSKPGKCHRWPYYTLNTVSAYWPFHCGHCLMATPQDIREIYKKQHNRHDCLIVNE